MKNILNIIKRVIRYIVVGFFASTILVVVAYRFLPVYFTPLMFIRVFQQAGAGDHIKMKHTWVSIDKISPYLPIAVMSSEDARFLDHKGFDFKAIETAAKKNLKKGKKRYGGSTISQQTAKNVFLWPGRSWLRKALESYFTLLIEFMWSKERIMEVYLNSIEMGKGIYGAEAVAEEHFNIEAKDLSKRQCALIAATLPNPIKFDSSKPTEYLFKRQRSIINEMNYTEKVIRKKWKYMPKQQSTK